MIRLILGIVIGAVIVVFAVQNTDTITYTFLAWELSAPRVVVVLAVFLFGLLTGWLVSGLGRLWRRR